MNSVPQVLQDVQALARAFLCVTDTPNGVRDWWKERDACWRVIQTFDHRPQDAAERALRDRDWLLSLFRRFTGEEVL
jgi:hypothetical protein